MAYIDRCGADAVVIEFCLALFNAAFALSHLVRGRRLQSGATAGPCQGNRQNESENTLTAKRRWLKRVD